MNDELTLLASLLKSPLLLMIVLIVIFVTGQKFCKSNTLFSLSYFLGFISVVNIILDFNSLVVLFSVIICSGILGGIIFALEAPHTHKLSFPWNGESRDSGWLGHVWVGIGGAIIATAAYMAILRIDVSFLVVEQQFKFDMTKDIVSQLIYFCAIGVLGGYSGLRIISGMSDTMLKKIQKQLDEQAKVSVENEAQLQKYQKKFDILEFENEYQKGLVNVANGNFEESVENFEKALKYKVIHNLNVDKAKLANLYAHRGLAYKRTDRLAEALNSILEAIETASDKPKYAYYFNAACYASMLNHSGQVIAHHLNRAIEIARKSPISMKALTRAINDDKDLDFFRLNFNNDFTEVLASLDSSQPD